MHTEESLIAFLAVEPDAQKIRLLAEELFRKALMRRRARDRLQSDQSLPTWHVAMSTANGGGLSDEQEIERLTAMGSAARDFSALQQLLTEAQALESLLLTLLGLEIQPASQTDKPTQVACLKVGEQYGVMLDELRLMQLMAESGRREILLTLRYRLSAKTMFSDRRSGESPSLAEAFCCDQSARSNALGFDWASEKSQLLGRIRELLLAQ